jgi:hypothetical protein
MDVKMDIHRQADMPVLVQLLQRVSYLISWLNEYYYCSKPSSGILCRVLLVRTDVSEERVASIFRVGGKDKRNSPYPEDGGDTFLRNVGSNQ